MWPRRATLRVLRSWGGKPITCARGGHGVPSLIPNCRERAAAWWLSVGPGACRIHTASAQVVSRHVLRSPCLAHAIDAAIQHAIHDDAITSDQSGTPGAPLRRLQTGILKNVCVRSCDECG